MSYNNQSGDKPLPSIEYTLKSIGWNVKVIADCLTKIVNNQISQPHQDKRSNEDDNGLGF